MDTLEHTRERLTTLPDAPAEALTRVAVMIAALHAWESEWAPRRDLDGAAQAYQVLLATHRAEPRDPAPVALAWEPSHDPDREVVLASGVEGDVALVLTEVDKGVNLDPELAAILGSDHYVYELRRRGETWVLVALDLVDADGRFPGL